MELAKTIETAIELFSDKIMGIQCTEATAQSLLYHSLLCSGFHQKRVCRELLRSADQHERADIAIFSSDYQGKFSLFENADQSKSNELLKSNELEAILEIKGGYHTTKTALGKLSIWLDLYKKGQVNPSNPLRDIDKLEDWKQSFPKVKYFGFVAIDFPETRVIDNQDPVAEIGEICRSKGTYFIYVNGQTGTYKIFAPCRVSNARDGIVAHPD